MLKFAQKKKEIFQILPQMSKFVDVEEKFAILLNICQKFVVASFWRVRYYKEL